MALWSGPSLGMARTAGIRTPLTQVRQSGGGFDFFSAVDFCKSLI